MDPRPLYQVLENIGINHAIDSDTCKRRWRVRVIADVEAAQGSNQIVAGANHAHEPRGFRFPSLLSEEGWLHRSRGGEPRAMNHEIPSMKRELAKLEGGDGESKPAATTSAGLENLRRFRDMKFLERLTELLTQQFEAAKIDEARNAAVIQVMDKAIEPDRKSKPKRSLIVILTALVAGFLAVIWAFIREAGQRARQNPEQASRLEALRGYMRWSNKSVK